MEFEPAIDRSRLLEAVRGAFGLEINAVRFVPVGYAAACYELTKGTNPVAFLKVWAHTATGLESATRLPIVLPLLAVLQTRPLRARIPAPLHTRTGETTLLFEEVPCVVFEFIKGSYPNGWPDVSPALWDEMARTLAEIHSVDDLGGIRLPEGFRFFEPKLDRRPRAILGVSVGPNDVADPALGRLLVAGSPGEDAPRSPTDLSDR